MSATTQTSVWGPDVPTITESLGTEIITVAWQGTQEDTSLLDLWGRVYSYTYSWMTALKITGDLWAMFKRLACKSVAGAGRVLDVGTGTGLISLALLDDSPTVEVVAADWSEHFLRRAQRNLRTRRNQGRVALWRVDLTQSWPWPDNSFGGVTAHYVLPYLPRAGQITILREAYRVLQPKSVFLVDFMRAGSSFREIVRHNIPSELRANPLALLKGLLLIPIFTKKADKARQDGLTYDFLDEEFLKVVREIGYRHAEIVGEGLTGPNSSAVPIWKLVK